MKVPFMCTRCFESGVTDGAQFVRLTPEESGLYNVECNRGHSTLTVLQQMRFEILFEIGVTAIKDGYFREAISSFTASLERFFEFYVEMVFREKKADPTLRSSVWKLVSSQSERQLGAYLFLYAIHENEKPKYLSDKEIQFRNAVIHKGRFPTAEEALNFGNSVMGIINPIIRRFRDRSPEMLLQLVMDYQSEILIKSKKISSSSMCYNTTISIAYDNSMSDCSDLRNRLKEIEIFQRMLGNPHGY